jgi:hypothetical protein
MIIYFIKGGLPWDKLYQNDSILQKKQNISIERLADGLPKGVRNFMKNIKNLTFESNFKRLLSIQINFYYW